MSTTPKLPNQPGVDTSLGFTMWQNAYFRKATLLHFKGKPSRRLSASEIVFLLALFSYQRGPTSPLYPGLRALSRLTGMSFGAVKNASDNLAEAGLIIRRPRGQGFSYDLSPLGPAFGPDVENLPEVVEEDAGELERLRAELAALKAGTAVPDSEPTKPVLVAVPSSAIAPEAFQKGWDDLKDLKDTPARRRKFLQSNLRPLRSYLATVLIAGKMERKEEISPLIEALTFPWVVERLDKGHWKNIALGVAHQLIYEISLTLPAEVVTVVGFNEGVCV